MNLDTAKQASKILKEINDIVKSQKDLELIGDITVLEITGTREIYKINGLSPDKSKRLIKTIQSYYTEEHQRLLDKLNELK